MASIKRVIVGNNRVRYRVRVRMRGHTAHRTFPNKREAQRFADERERAFSLEGLSPLGRSEVVTFGQAVARYRRQVLCFKGWNTQGQQSQQLDFWLRYFGTDAPLVNCTAPLIADAVDDLLPRSPKTINRYLAVLSHLFSRCVKTWRCMDRNPVADVERLPEGPNRTRYLNRFERRQLLKACKASSNPLLYTIVLCALSTGARKGELRGMRWDRLDLWQTMKVDGAVVEVGRYLLEGVVTKTGDPRYLVFFGEALQLLRKLSRSRKAGQVWCWPSRFDPHQPLDWRYPWENALDESGIENFCFHDLRHTTASYLGEQGASLAQIGEVLGHRSEATTAKYTHFTNSSVAPLVSRMTGRVFGRRAQQ